MNNLQNSNMKIRMNNHINRVKVKNYEKINNNHIEISNQQ